MRKATPCTYTSLSGLCINCATGIKYETSDFPRGYSGAIKSRASQPLTPQTPDDAALGWVTAHQWQQNIKRHIYVPLHILKEGRPLKAEPAHYATNTSHCCLLLQTAITGFFYFVHVVKDSWNFPLLWFTQTCSILLFNVVFSQLAVT